MEIIVLAVSCVVCFIAGCLLKNKIVALKDSLLGKVKSEL